MSAPYPELFAWVVRDASGRHGIMAITDPQNGYTMPTISTKRHVIETLRDKAKAAARETGHEVELRRYALAEILETMKP